MYTESGVPSSAGPKPTRKYETGIARLPAVVSNGGGGRGDGSCPGDSPLPSSAGLSAPPVRGATSSALPLSTASSLIDATFIAHACVEWKACCNKSNGG